jgi:hypothetical protein
VSAHLYIIIDSPLRQFAVNAFTYKWIGKGAQYGFFSKKPFAASWTFPVSEPSQCNKKSHHPYYANNKERIFGLKKIDR